MTNNELQSFSWQIIEIWAKTYAVHFLQKKEKRNNQSRTTVSGKMKKYDGNSDSNGYIVGDHPFSAYAKFSEKLRFRTSWYADIRVRIRG